MGRAIRYTLNQWECLIKFVSDAKLRLDNNISEAALRIVALGRDNFRWVGHDESGENLAILQTVDGHARKQDTSRTVRRVCSRTVSARKGDTEMDMRGVALGMIL